MSAAVCKLENAHVHVPAHVRTCVCAKRAMNMQAMWLFNWLQLHVIEIVIAERHCKRHAYKPRTCQYAEYQRGCNHKQQAHQAEFMGTKSVMSSAEQTTAMHWISCGPIIFVWLHLYISPLPQLERHNKKQHVTSKNHTSPEACGHPRRADICVSLKNTKSLKKSSGECKS